MTIPDVIKCLGNDAEEISYEGVNKKGFWL